MEDSIRLMLIQMVAKSDKYHARIQELARILNIIHDPITSNSDAKVFVDGLEYGFDELLMLVFEFTQLISGFETYKEAETSLRAFLIFHSDRLIDLCLAGKLNHLSEIIEFRKRFVK